MSLDWDAVAAFALRLPDAALSTHYGKPAIKANGRAVIATSDDPSSFVLHIDRDTKALLMEIDPDTFWQTSHYDGWPALLVRYDSTDPERVLASVERAHGAALAMRKGRKRV